MGIKAFIKQLCAHHPFLDKVIGIPYSNYCEKRRVRREINIDYKLNDAKVCLAGIERQPGINFWFLLEQGHNNIGDIAIGVAEKRFFERYFPQMPKHFIYENVFAAYRREIKSQIRPEDVIVLRGGGSIGNTKLHEKRREEIISCFPDNLIVSMPQTMCFADTKQGRQDKAKAATAYEKNRNLILLAREEQSYLDMKATFPRTQVILTPDIVMTQDFHLPQERREGILLCFRSDWEKSLTQAEVLRIETLCRSLSGAVQYTDMYAKERFIPLKRREEVLNEKIGQFKRASLVVTDRLHGMVFCAITGTPCIALSNYNHKVAQTYKWLQNLPYIQYCCTVEDALLKIPQMYGCMSGEYSNEFTVPYFEKLAKLIKQHYEEVER